MQQYPVPQFTDIEDTIIGRFTIKQFGIIFGAGGIVFAIFSATKNIPVTVIAGLLIGLPAVFIALFPFNGRRVYNMVPVFFRFFFAPKLYMFEKQSADQIKSLQPAEKAETVQQVSREAATSRLKELNYLLEHKAAEEEELFKPNSKPTVI